MNTHTELLTYLAGLTRCQRYLELGVHDGANFLSVPSPYKLGVDTAPNPRVAEVLKMTTDAFFENHAAKVAPFDLIFIDADHVGKQVSKDLASALDVLNERNPYACIVMHDCNPRTADEASPVAHHRAWCGTVWQAWVDLRNHREAPWARVVDFDYGCGVILPAVQDPKPWDPEERLQAGQAFTLGFEWLDRYRDRALGLLSIDLFLRELGSLESWADGIRTGDRARALLGHDVSRE
jgi:hypothetical protein